MRLPWDTFSDEEKRKVVHEAMIAVDLSEKLPTEGQLDKAIESLIRYKADEIFNKFNDELARKVIDMQMKKLISDFRETAVEIGQMYMIRFVLQKQKKLMEAMVEIAVTDKQFNACEFMLSFVTKKESAKKKAEIKKKPTMADA
jgi:hypothetical protein